MLLHRGVLKWFEFISELKKEIIFCVLFFWIKDSIFCQNKNLNLGFRPVFLGFVIIGLRFLVLYCCLFEENCDGMVKE